jgi:hypothetical protein
MKRQNLELTKTKDFRLRLYVAAQISRPLSTTAAFSTIALAIESLLSAGMAAAQAK